MPRKSHAILTPKETEELNVQLFSYIASLTTAEAVRNFIGEFLTEEEKIMLSKRLALYALLYSGRDLTYIQQTLGVSQETTRTYNAQKHYKSQKFQEEMKRIGKSKKTGEVISKIEKKFKILDLILDSSHNMKARRKLLTGDFLDSPQD